MQRCAIYAKNESEGVKVIDTCDRPHGPLAKGVVLVKVICAGVNPVDAKFQIGDKFPESFEPVLRWLMEGRGVGFDFAGIVEEAGDSIYKKGDHVYGCVPPLQGSIKEYTFVPSHQIARKPAKLSFQEAAVLPLVGLTAYQSLKLDYGLKKGDHLLLIGASGGVGHVAIQVAKRLGAHITAICSGRNAELVKSLGTDVIIDYSTQPIMESLEKTVSENGPFDICFDCVSSHDSRDTSVFNYEVEVLARKSLVKGIYVTIGGKTYQWIIAGLKRTVGLNLFSWFTPGRELFWIRFPYSSEALQTLSEWANEGAIKPLVSQVCKFDSEGLQTAFSELHSRRVVGKVVIDVAKL